MRHGKRILFLLALAVGAGSAQTPAEIEKEIALGKHLAAELDRRAAPLNDPGTTALLRRILQTLAANSALRLPVQLKLLASDEAIASALPGGWLLFSSGAMLRARTEAELAALLAHAMGHIQAGSGITMGPGVVGGRTIPFILMGGPNGACMRSNPEALMPVSLLSRWRESEAQADFLGLEYLANAGYDPQAMITVFERWKGALPSDEATVARASELARALPAAVLNTSEFEEIKRQVAPPARRPPTLHR
jgi:predicted Zn-dependent protease